MTDAPDVDDRRDTPLADQPASLGETPTLVFQGDDATREPQTTGLIGQVIDARYRVLERLAGDDGAVYLAEHMRLSKQVVLKTISATAFGRDDAFARFEREARVTAVLDHPHIVCVMDYGRLDDGGAYLITQLVRGQSLTALLDAGPLSWPLACDIAVQIADALAAAHERGIVHRDLSPDNVMLERTSDDRQFARVVNFGIARIVNDAAGVPGGREALTRIGVVLGNPGYMAPEQAVGGEVDARADLYALGVMLWESITGRRLWPAPDLTALFKLQLTRDPPPLAELVPGVPEELSKLVAGLLQRDVDARSSSASELCATLRRLVSEAGPVERWAPPPIVAPLPTSLAPVEGEAPAPVIDAPAPADAAPSLTPPKPTARSALALLGARIAEESRALVDEWRRREFGLRSRLVAMAAATLLIALVLALTLGGDDDDAEDPTPAAAEAKAAAGEATTAVDAPAPETEQAPTLPRAELDHHIDAVITGKTRTARRESATALLSYRPEADVPPHARLAAKLEDARTCKDKLAVLLKIEELAAPELLPALQRLKRTPDDTCGKGLKKRDCYACLRADLDRILTALKPAKSGG